MRLLPVTVTFFTKPAANIAGSVAAMIPAPILTLSLTFKVGRDNFGVELVIELGVFSVLTDGVKGLAGASPVLPLPCNNSGVFSPIVDNSKSRLFFC